MTAATHFIDARVSRHIGTYSDAVAIPAGVCIMKSSARNSLKRLTSLNWSERT
jgi:hypothetical protein